ncbi:TrbC/VirB2 family protein [bacterium]|nr:TrbC/VirB2 family protein [bacterium]
MKIIKILILNKVFASELPNPIGTTSFGELLDRILNYLIAVAVPVAGLALVWSAFQMVASEGEVEKINEAKRTIKWAIIGLIIVFFAKGLVLVIKNILSG